MASEIITLPDNVIELIAAGEVIDSMAAVIRELVENSLDAGASRISIALTPELWQVQVADNGRGMTLEDLKVCTQPHSTSKIRSQADLWRISSLGFRGEALHSLAQVADLAICSRRTHQSNTGWQVVYQDGGLVQESLMALAPGTIVKVSNLFARIPVRRRALPPLPQRLKNIHRLIQHLALCHPQVTWQIRQQGQSWFNISPGKSARELLPQFLRRVGLQDLHYLKLEAATPQDSQELVATQAAQNYDAAKRSTPLSKSQIELVLGLPDRCHRHRRDWVKVAVNNRVVHLPELEQTIFSHMAQTLPRDRFPIAWLHLHLAPHQIDWNRHPAKAEIYLHSIHHWQTEVGRAIGQALELSTVNLPDKLGDRRMKQILKVAEAKSGYQLDRNLAAESWESQVAKPVPSLVNSLQLKAVAQVNKTYIVAEHSSGVWLVEQHIAHERVLFEQLQDFWELVALDTTLTLENLQPSQLAQLQAIGIQIEAFGDNIWAVRNIPKLLQGRPDGAAALWELSWGGDLRTAQVATACRSAIRNGQVLSLPEMQNLLDLWQHTRNPSTCPHGRPIYLALEESSLARFFRRHWVIGKSHGI